MKDITLHFSKLQMPEAIRNAASRYISEPATTVVKTCKPKPKPTQERMIFEKSRINKWMEKHPAGTYKDYIEWAQNQFPTDYNSE